MRVVGITIARDAERLDYPLPQAIESILPVVDEMIVNVGRSQDQTAELIARFFQGRPVRVLERDWDVAAGAAVLAHETQLALEMADSDWVVYIQADEVLHESGVKGLRESMAQCVGDDGVEGLLVNFVHHYGTPDRVATARRWYRSEVRVVRPKAGVLSFEEAQGFRVGESKRRVRCRPTAAVYHHYGWARPAAALKAKLQIDDLLYGRKRVRGGPIILPWEYGLRRFQGTHPYVMRDWIATRRGTFAPLGERRWNLEQVRYVASELIERLSGVRPWEYRNYVLV